LSKVHLGVCCHPTSGSLSRVLYLLASELASRFVAVHMVSFK